METDKPVLLVLNPETIFHRDGYLLAKARLEHHRKMRASRHEVQLTLIPEDMPQNGLIDYCQYNERRKSK